MSTTATAVTQSTIQYDNPSSEYVHSVLGLMLQKIDETLKNTATENSVPSTLSFKSLDTFAINKDGEKQTEERLQKFIEFFMNEWFKEFVESTLCELDTTILPLLNTAESISSANASHNTAASATTPHNKETNEKELIDAFLRKYIHLIEFTIRFPEFIKKFPNLYKEIPLGLNLYLLTFANSLKPLRAKIKADAEADKTTNTNNPKTTLTFDYKGGPQVPSPSSSTTAITAAATPETVEAKKDGGKSGPVTTLPKK